MKTMMRRLPQGRYVRDSRGRWTAEKAQQSLASNYWGDLSILENYGRAVLILLTIFGGLAALAVTP